jgi:hypothetical protein
MRAGATFLLLTLLVRGRLPVSTMGRPRKKLFLTTVVDRDLYEKARRLAKYEDRSIAAMIRRLIAEMPEPEQATGT